MLGMRVCAKAGEVLRMLVVVVRRPQYKYTSVLLQADDVNTGEREVVHRIVLSHVRF
jgi:hypothetical protein